MITEKEMLLTCIKCNYYKSYIRNIEDKHYTINCTMLNNLNYNDFLNSDNKLRQCCHFDYADIFMENINKKELSNGNR